MGKDRLVGLAHME